MVPLESLAESAGESVVLWSIVLWRVVVWSRALRDFARCEEGLETLEWCIMGALLIVLAAIAIDEVGTRIEVKYGLMLAEMMQ